MSLPNLRSRLRVPGSSMAARLVLLVTVAVVALACGCGGGASSSSGSNPSASPPPSGPTTLVLTTVIGGLHAPLDMQQPNDNSNRFFIVEQAGTIRILQNAMLIATPFLDISSKVVTQSESGLLGLAFHPSYAQNRRFYVNYVRDNSGQVQSFIAEFQTSGNANQADSATERDLLVIDQPNFF